MVLLNVCDQQFMIRFQYLFLKLECTYCVAACRPTLYCHESGCRPVKSCTINSKLCVTAFFGDGMSVYAIGPLEGSAERQAAGINKHGDRREGY